ncbi:MAG: hypothetical protein Q7T73_03445 [Beijerinckiaceae bacterium]|nr:hypothetical protein [Beijerinckiaceae bacterium]
MGAFNTIDLEAPDGCWHCGALGVRRIQFKFGDTWQYHYKPGETLRWGGNRNGRSVRHARVLGYYGDCPECGGDLGYVELDYQDGAIVVALRRVDRLAEPYIEADEQFLVVEE